MPSGQCQVFYTYIYVDDFKLIAYNSPQSLQAALDAVSSEDKKMYDDSLARAQEKAKQLIIQRYGADHVYPDLFK
ncbi:hypothetical protein Y032_0781g2313 [Ancylostoma ceylanicum]|uniref:Uncharacterized protein n=1 Tax=Ancylostoma ceylanicum TaxID=53326 RepID=A0A016WDA1_9BILA|nr:hypothetical protein Y032_0781g2313 [Ancylostoma ceylanicum]